MKKIILLRGLPASGKSTWAKEMIKKNPGTFKRINKDDLRAMLDNSHWSRDNEKFVIKMRDICIAEALNAGKHVIVDDTNLHAKHEIRMQEIAKAHNAQVEVKFFDVGVDDCIARDLKRPVSVGADVIRKMHKDFLLPKTAPYNGDGLPSAIIVDIDGTLALKSNRSPFDWHRVGEDTPNLSVVNLVKEIAQSGFHKEIIIFSGRDSICKSQTEEWLCQHEIPYHQLYMRPNGNCEKDSVIKSRLFDEHVRGKYNVEFVLDDRDQVVEMWRSIGLVCFQVAYGDF